MPSLYGKIKRHRLADAALKTGDWKKDKPPGHKVFVVMKKE